MSVPRKFLARTRACSLIATIALALPAIVPAGAQQASAAPTRLSADDPLPADKSFIKGTLPNGLTYYIKKAKKPEHRAELRLVVRAGSNQEDDDQRGLAHLVEHMQFNGSPHFPKKGDLIAYFQSIGMNFGADLNAFTSFDQTAYELRLPSTDPKLLERGFDVLQDWAGRATFDSVNVLAERDIVLEEWRRMLGVGKRMSTVQLPVMFKGSRYAQREPIGDPDIIKSATLAKLQRYYREWYRPDLMAVIAVGDFDPAQVEAWIKERFSILTNPSSARARTVFPIPGNTEPIISIYADTQQTAMTASVTYKLPLQRVNTVRDYRGSLVRQMFAGALNQRLYERGFADPAPFLSAGVSYGSLGEDVSTFETSVTSRNGELAQGMDALFSEIERIARFGITEAELDRMRGNMLRNMEMEESESRDLPGGAYVAAFAANFMTGAPIVDNVLMTGVVKQVLPTITLEEIQKEALIWRQKQNRIISVTLPKATGVAVPDSTSLLTVFDDVARAPLTAYVDRPVLKPLMEKPPAGGKIVSTRKLAKGITEWTLSNGIRVFAKPSTNTPNSIMIRGSGPGGYATTLKLGTIPSITAGDIVGSSGVADFDPIELGKILSGRAVRYQFGIGQYEQTMSAGARLDDFETALQLLYLQATQPRVDPTVMAAVKRNYEIGLFNRSANPDRVYGDTVRLTMSSYHPMVRAAVLTQATIDSLDGDKSLAVFKQLFSDMGQFDFVVVGSFRPDSIAPLIARYLGALPGKPVPASTRKIASQRKIQGLGIRVPDGVIYKKVAQGDDPKTTVSLVFHGPLTGLSLKEDWDYYAMVQVLRMRLLERLRMQMSGTYTVAVNGSFATAPTPEYRYSLTVMFVCDPHRADELAKAALAVMDSMQRAPATASEVQIVREQQIHQIEQMQKNDGVLLTSIDTYAREGWPFEKLDIASDLVRDWTAADVQTAAKKYFNFKRYARFDLVPAASAASK